jgi:hypothetical protein
MTRPTTGRGRPGAPHGRWLATVSAVGFPYVHPSASHAWPGVELFVLVSGLVIAVSTGILTSSWQARLPAPRSVEMITLG